MEKEIKIGDNTFVLKMPEAMLDKSVSDVLKEWCKLVEIKDEWTVLPILPQYRFKNLSIVSSPFDKKEDANEISLTINCDSWEELK